MKKTRNKKLAEFIYRRLDSISNNSSKVLYDSSVREALQTLDPTGDVNIRQKEYVIKKLSLCSMIMAGGLIVSAILWIKDGTQTKIVENCIERNVYGDGEKDVTLIAEDSVGTYEIALSVKERLYNESELNMLLERFLPLLEKTILGENASFDNVSYNFKLVNCLEGFPFEVEWQTDGEYVDSEGKLMQNILDKPKLVEITAVISCDTYEVHHELSCMIYSKAIQPSQEELITEALQKIQDETRNEKFMTLPSEMNAEQINWSYKKNSTGILLLIATPLLVLVIYFGTDKDLKKQVADREEQLKIDYPEIVSALALLIGAGMTVPNAWQRVVKDYQKRMQKTGRKRFAYEEMLLTVYEMESGITQTKAYERFGRRCRAQSYNRLAAMLSQNVRKGATNLAVLLREEAVYAFEDRKHTARRLGEKAGTKLLMPMMMLLCMIMVIIMIPAFQGYF